MGAGGREPAKKVVEAYYSSRNNHSYKGCTAYLRFPRAAGKGKGRGRRLRGNPGPLARR